MNLLPLSNKLESDSLGTPGRDLFVHFMPMETKLGILLRAPLAGTPIDHELPGYYKCEFKAVVRAHQFDKALALAQEVMDSLTIYEQQLDDIYVRYVRPRSLPAVYPVSSANFFEVEVVYEAVYMDQAYGRPD